MIRPPNGVGRTTAQAARRVPTFTKPPKDLISAEECAAMIQARLKAYHERSKKARMIRLAFELLVIGLVVAWGMSR